MLKNLCLSVILITMGANMFNYANINDYFKIVSGISIFHDNKQILVDKNKQIKIIDTLKEITSDAHEMPALGVALDQETRHALTDGLWLELQFDETITHLDMPFDALLINVEPEASGFNLIRHHDGIYEGRCYYLSLTQDMGKLYNIIMEVIK